MNATIQAPASQCLYFDMEGVLCAYNKSDYRPGRNGEPARADTHGAHMYLGVPENPNVMQAFCMLYGFMPPGTCKVFTGVPNGITHAEHVIDKFNWMKKRLSTFRQEDFLCVSVDDYADPVPPPYILNRGQILIDDYDPNLANWTALGGLSVKCLNGLNSRNPAYYNLDAGARPGDIMNAILAVLQGRM